jgi:hypothetical protein
VIGHGLHQVADVLRERLQGDGRRRCMLVRLLPRSYTTRNSPGNPSAAEWRCSSETQKTLMTLGFCCRFLLTLV